MKNFILECCVDSAESALAAKKGGADRLELCSALVIGGLSPSIALFQKIRELMDIRIHVLLRPRFGDFCYTENEHDIIRNEIRMFREAGAQGVVIGSLKPDGSLDMHQMRELITEAKGMSVTLHRAFDMCRDPFETLEQAKELGINTILTSGQKNSCKLITEAKGMSVTLHRAFDMCRDPFETLEQAKELGINTILTSGQKNSCMDGAELLEELVRASAGQVDILLGAGINAEVIPQLYAQTGATSYHMSGKIIEESSMQYRRGDVNMGIASMSEYEIWRTSEEKIRAAKSVLEFL